MSILRPILKNMKKSLNDSNNYRSIAISSIMLTILDNIILSKHSGVLCSSDMQFGFKRLHSTTHCTFETIDYYVRNGSSVYVTLIDASKAFDRVNFIALFRLLLTP